MIRHIAVCNMDYRKSIYKCPVGSLYGFVMMTAICGSAGCCPHITGLENGFRVNGFIARLNACCDGSKV